MHLIISDIRINLISAPAGLIIRMHRNTGIPDVFQIRHNGCRRITDVLLINNRSARQESHRISGQIFPLRVRCLRAKHGRQSITLRRILFQRINKRCQFHIRLQLSQYAQIRKRLIHNYNNRWILHIRLGIILIIRLVFLLQRLNRFLRITIRCRHKAIPDSKDKI